MGRGGCEFKSRRSDQFYDKISAVKMDADKQKAIDGLNAVELNCHRALSDKHEDCAHSFEDWDDINAAQPLYRKIPREVRLRWHWWVLNPYNATVGRGWHWVKERGRLMVHGYDPNAYWDHRSYISRIAWRQLERLRQSKHMGCPGNWGCEKCVGSGIDSEFNPWNCPCKPFDRWREAIDDMAFFHKVAAGEMDEVEITYTSSFGPNTGKEVTYRSNPEFHNLSEADQRRYRRGKWLYFKWYEHLWD